MDYSKDWHIEIYRGISRSQSENLSRLTSIFEPKGRERRTHSPEYYSWKLSDAPLGKGILAAGINSQDEIIASTTVAIKNVYLDGIECRGGEFGDSFTRQDYQRQGIMTQLVKQATAAALEDNIELIYTTPNHQSLPGYERKCSFSRKQHVDPFFWALPLQPCTVLANSKPVFSPLRPLDALPRFACNALTAGVDNSIQFHEEPRFDSAYDELNDILCKRYQFMVSRTSSYLKYRFIDNPERHLYRLMEYRTSQNTLEGAMIVKECVHDGLKVLFIADIFGLKTEIIQKLWKSAIRLGIEKKSHIIALWKDRSFQTCREMLPFVAVPVSRKNLMIYRSADREGFINSSEPIIFSISDTDNI